MFYGFFATWVILGLLGISNLIIAKKPNAKEVFEKVAPYQGWFGVACALWGAWGVISAILEIKVLAIFPILWIFSLAMSGLMVLLGALFGVGVATSFMSNPAQKEKLAQTVAKVAPFQAILGFLLLGGAVFTLIDALVLHI